MIKSILTQTLNATRRSLVPQARQYCSTLKLIREEDALTQAQIDELLGNEPSQEVAAPESKEKELVEREMFYGLIPTKNEHFPPCIDPEYVPLLETPNQNIMAAMGLTVDSSFGDYCSSMQSFWREDDLYGDTTPAAVIEAESLEFKNLLTTDSKYLQRLRKGFAVNPSLPGTIEV